MSESALRETVIRWDQAIVSNDVNQISPFMTDDWVIVGADGITTKADFLVPIASGKLTHNRMDSDEMHITIKGNTAVVISKGTSAGTWMGEDFSLYEWSTSTFIWIDGKWLCMVTMLTMVK
ncbi:nuclear transport factor 2 family protein [Pseudobacter ginsenosidimutans]|uniref:Ketosteroid isomerase-like protein n=1 Tax=Pseudobacter ginsenosidimutans TaxID=661488 RepID=A0A4Q7N557_9BACT|nr:nuclear transport factor 2 family protein [Pseudobacter ginsenosidimutans]QEC44702.1 nuclear transport factor 2 family protein [Pseudobacter ginsenosidimutans]RZS76183.1 ketosteroid isomerase-like protein [Pseudobacter ginsenosidimutans]